MGTGWRLILNMIKTLSMGFLLSLVSVVLFQCTALVKYNQGLSLLEQLREDNEVLFLKAHINYSLGLIAFLSNNFEDATSKYILSKDNFTKISYHEQSAEILFRLIDIKSQLGDLSTAWEFSKELGSNFKKIKDKSKK